MKYLYLKNPIEKFKPISIIVKGVSDPKLAEEIAKLVQQGCTSKIPELLNSWEVLSASTRCESWNLVYGDVFVLAIFNFVYVLRNSY